MNKKLFLVVVSCLLLLTACVSSSSTKRKTPQVKKLPLRVQMRSLLLVVIS